VKCELILVQGDVRTSLSLLYTFALFFFKSTRGNLLVKDIFNVVSHVHTKYDRVYNRKMSTQNGIVI